MALTVGSRLGHYDVTALIGGEMGHEHRGEHHQARSLEPETRIPKTWSLKP